MKIIFLDIDGVLCTTRAHVATGSHGFMMKALDREGVGLLNRMAIDSTKFVLSSTWRNIFSQEWMEDHLRRHGWTGEFHEDWRTPHNPMISHPDRRPDEIAEWLSKNPIGDKGQYVILDDDAWNWSLEQQNHVVRTIFDNGIMWEDFLKADKILHGHERWGLF